MTDSVLTCPKCDCGMVRGFIPEVIVGETQVTTWSEGAPEWAFWGGAKGSGANPIPIGAYRCSECGYLELYARPEFKAAGGPLP